MGSLKCLLVAAIEKLCELIDVLTELYECACGECETDCPPPVPLAGAEGGDASWISGPNAGAAVAYPTTNHTTIQDWTTTATVSEAEIAACCGEKDPGAALVLRFKIQHQQTGIKHTGFRLIASAGTWSAVSPNNTSGLGTLGTAVVGIGTAANTPDDVGFVERWAELTTTCGDLVAGITFTSFAFDGVDNPDEFAYGELMNGLAAEIVKIEGC